MLYFYKDDVIILYVSLFCPSFLFFLALHSTNGVLLSVRTPVPIESNNLHFSIIFVPKSPVKSCLNKYVQIVSVQSQNLHFFISISVLFVKFMWYLATLIHLS